jgi:hypothetical protein
MKNPILIIVAVVAIIAVAALYVYRSGTNEVLVSPTPIELTTEGTVFAWLFAEAKTSNLDGLPKTDIFLTITYNHRSIERLVDTVPGGCSLLEGQIFEGDISTAGSVQCYAAGFGQQYRITQNQYIFFVERRFFEEALPDVMPPVYEWEVVSEFSFT